MFVLGDNRPRPGYPCLEEDNMGGGADGQASEPNVSSAGDIDPTGEVSTPDTVDPPEEQYFHKITIPGKDGTDDETLAFKDPKELSDSYLRNRFRRDDYTRKTQELAEQRKKLEQEMSGLTEKEKSIMQLSNKYSEFDNLFKDVTAQQMRQIVDQVRGVVKNKSPEQKALDERLAKLEAKEQEAERQQKLEERKRANKQKYEASGRYLKSQYGDDYDHERVMEELDRLNSVDPEMAHQAILEMVYHASKGKSSKPKLEDPQGPPRTKTGTTAATPPKGKMTIEEARKAALAEMGF